ncbi:ankyrin repeat-containing domain protein [Thelonectria olida]|uniref:Ankyrin repeat-containing domain protein n=1 Tax=Thelonectria olida TaxID=1576542 RepID=A0A9P8W973_9HYPO|nr:ankyrin repeat-containing domain protein [Thelonectria olida]
MEVLGALASAIAIAQAVAAGRGAANMLREIPEIQGDFEALRREIDLIDAMIKEARQLSRSPSDQTAIPLSDAPLIGRTTRELVEVSRELNQVVEGCAEDATGNTEWKAKKRKWFFQKNTIGKLQMRVRDAKSSLHFAIVCHLAASNARQEQFNATATQFFELFSKHVSVLALPEPPATSLRVEEESKAVPAENQIKTNETVVNEGELVRTESVHARINNITPMQPKACAQSCKCRCHFQQMRYRSAAWLQLLMGSWVIDCKPTVPGLRRGTCTESDCERSSEACVSLEGRPPEWLWEGVMSLKARYGYSTGLSCRLRTARSLKSNDSVWAWIKQSVRVFQEGLNQGVPYFPDDRKESGRDLIEYAIRQDAYDVLEFLLILWKNLLPYHGVSRRVALLAHQKMQDDKHKRLLTDRQVNLLDQAISCVENSDNETNQRCTSVFKAVEQGQGLGEALAEQSWALNVIDSRTGWAPIHAAVHRDQTPSLRQLIAAHADVDRGDWQGVTPLMRAAANGRLECIRLLLRAKCRVDQRAEFGRTALHFAVIGGSSEAVAMLLAAGASAAARTVNGRTPLHFVSEAVTEYKVARSIVQLLTSVAKDGDIEARDGVGATPTFLALWMSNVAALRCLIEAGGSLQAIDKSRRNALHLAAHHGSLDLLRHLNKLNELSSLDINTELRDKSGNTPWDAIVYCTRAPQWDLGFSRRPSLDEQQAFIRLHHSLRHKQLLAEIYSLRKAVVALSDDNKAEACAQLTGLVKQMTNVSGTA